MKINFSSLQKKYPLLDSEDISFLNEFFNKPEILSKFEKINAIRKKRMKLTLVLELIGFIFLLYLFYNSTLEFNSLTIQYFIIIECFLAYWIYFLAWIFFMDLRWKIKNEILPKLTREINSELNYDIGEKYYFWDVDKLINCWLLNKYDRLDIIEDSINFEPKTVDQNTWKENIPYSISWYEFKTSEEHQDKNGTHYEVNNHCYLLKVTFNNARQKISSWITLKRDVNDNFYRKLFNIFAIDFSIIGGYFVITQWENGDNYGMIILENISKFINVPLWLFFITLLIAIFIITYQIYSSLINKKRVRTENTQFEKEFDVYCNDQILSRKILTPSFMYRIFDFVNKIDKKRSYEFYFLGSNIFIKLDLKRMFWNTYMEVLPTISMFNNMKQFINFYIEIKNVVSLAHDLWLEYFDKDTFENKVIK